MLEFRIINLFLIFSFIVLIPACSKIRESAGVTRRSIDEVDGVSIDIKKASGSKCNRCWKILEEVTSTNKICHRCKDAIGSIKNKK